MQVLIVYGSKRGGTAGLAHMIATAFEREGWRADVRDAAEGPGIGDVDAVIVGGALYMNRWPKPLRRWVHHHTPTLQKVPVWFFSSGPLDASARAGDIAPVPSVAKLAREIEISGHQTFGGYLDRNPKGYFAHQMAKRYAGDWRDPQQVEEWVHDICRRMSVVTGMPEQRPPAPTPQQEPRTPV
jgi:menaquinone-dependent protoporphyrinogen oxidase